MRSSVPYAERCVKRLSLRRGGAPSPTSCLAKIGPYQIIAIVKPVTPAGGGERSDQSAPDDIPPDLPQGSAQLQTERAGAWIETTCGRCTGADAAFAST